MSATSTIATQIVKTQDATRVHRNSATERRSRVMTESALQDISPSAQCRGPSTKQLGKGIPGRRRSNRGVAQSEQGGRQGGQDQGGAQDEFCVPPAMANEGDPVILIERAACVRYFQIHFPAEPRRRHSRRRLRRRQRKVCYYFNKLVGLIHREPMAQYQKMFSAKDMKKKKKISLFRACDQIPLPVNPQNIWNIHIKLNFDTLC